MSKLQVTKADQFLIDSSNYWHKDIVRNLNDEKNNLNELKRIIDKELIETVFQPIVCLKTGKSVAYEALSRGPQGSSLMSPEKMFAVAKEHNLLNELEYLCRMTSIKNSQDITKTHFLFINVDPLTLEYSVSPEGITKSFLSQQNIPLDKIVLEVTEKSTISDYSSFTKTISHYRKQGYNIAIDDTGSGYSGLQLMMEIRPEWIKLDMSLVRDIDKNQYKKLFIKHFFQFALTANIAVIAEGVESQNELNELIDIGIPYAQGYFLKKPSSDFNEINPELASFINRQNKQNSYYFKNSPTVATVGHIARFDKTTKKNTLGSYVYNHFNEDTLVQGIVIVENNRPIGLIMRDSFNKFLSSHFGFSIYSSRPIEEIMNTDPLIVEYDTTIIEASRMANARTDSELYDYIIITKNGYYHGIVSVKLLLEKVIDMEIASARNCNPLTKLPGNHEIHSRLSKFIEYKTPFSALYLDMDNFKSYNDKYGFIKGDRILVFFAELLKKILNVFSNTTFLGHIGGDDFFIITSGGDVKALCNSIIIEFDEKIKHFYSREDLINASLYRREQTDGVPQIPVVRLHSSLQAETSPKANKLVSISIAVLDNNLQFFDSVDSINNELSKLKAKCKKIQSSCFYVSTTT